MPSDNEKLIENIKFTINQLEQYLQQAYDSGLVIDINSNNRNGFSCRIKNVQKLVDMSIDFPFRC